MSDLEERLISLSPLLNITIFDTFYWSKINKHLEYSKQKIYKAKWKIISTHE